MARKKKLSAPNTQSAIRDPSFFFSAHSIFSISFSDILALNFFTFCDLPCVSTHGIRLPFVLHWLLCFSEFNSGLGFMGWLSRLALAVKFSFLRF
ncbi:hypothetical protein VNO80_18794 [Phaseolus coccineus]|uniref:Uncharacterized protein n=1 Tax=Phaseolus coccineus TaxID=3886 RepID=A0AAN9ML16_PHACN